MLRSQRPMNIVLTFTVHVFIHSVGDVTCIIFAPRTTTKLKIYSLPPFFLVLSPFTNNKHATNGPFLPSKTSQAPPPPPTQPEDIERCSGNISLRYTPGGDQLANCVAMHFIVGDNNNDDGEKVDQELSTNEKIH